MEFLSAPGTLSHITSVYYGTGCESASNHETMLRFGSCGPAVEWLCPQSAAFLSRLASEKQAQIQL